MKIDSILPVFVIRTPAQTKRISTRTRIMNNTDFVVHIQTENDTLLGRIERESNEVALEDVNRVRRIIIGLFVAISAVFGTIAIMVACM